MSTEEPSATSGPRRWAAGLEYAGVGYSGWQTVSANRSLQATFEAALSRVADHPVAVTAAGRTDAGVHAQGQVVHFDSPARRRGDMWMQGANSLLPPGLGVHWVREVSLDFDARRSAVARRYRYVIENRRARPGVWAGRVGFVPRPLDAHRMHVAAQVLVGEHDFSSFRSSDCQSRSPWRQLSAISVGRAGTFVIIDVRANAFLHHMVRNIVGTLIPIGQGVRESEWLAAVLAVRDRRQAGPTALPDGLYFRGPEYPSRFGLPAPAAAALPAGFAAVAHDERELSWDAPWRDGRADDVDA